LICNIAQLVHPDGFGRHRFLWKDGGQSVAMLRYDKAGTYTGATRIAVELARAAWSRKIDQGWKRLPLTAIGQALTPDDKPFADYLY